MGDNSEQTPASEQAQEDVEMAVTESSLDPSSAVGQSQAVQQNEQESGQESGQIDGTIHSSSIQQSGQIEMSGQTEQSGQIQMSEQGDSSQIDSSIHGGDTSSVMQSSAVDGSMRDGSIHGGDTSILPDESSLAPSTDGAVSVNLQPRVLLQANAEFEERKDAFVMNGLDQCNMAQCWALFNGKIEKGKVTRLEWVSDWDLLAECVDEAACTEAFELVAKKYPNDDVPKEENEGPAIWRVRNGVVEVRKATVLDVKQPGFKKKMRGGKRTVEYRNDVKYCRDQGMDTNFATKLALKAQAEKAWNELTDLTDDPDLLEMDENKIKSSSQLLDLLSQKDSKTYVSNEIMGKHPNAVQDEPPPQFDAWGNPVPVRGPRGKGKGKHRFMDSMGDGGSVLNGRMSGPALIKDQRTNQELENFLDYMQGEQTPTSRSPGTSSPLHSFDAYSNCGTDDRSSPWGTGATDNRSTWGENRTSDNRSTWGENRTSDNRSTWGENRTSDDRSPWGETRTSDNRSTWGENRTSDNRSSYGTYDNTYTNTRPTDTYDTYGTSMKSGTDGKSGQPGAGKSGKTEGRTNTYKTYGDTYTGAGYSFYDNPYGNDRFATKEQRSAEFDKHARERSRERRGRDDRGPRHDGGRDGGRGRDDSGRGGRDDGYEYGNGRGGRDAGYNRKRRDRDGDYDDYIDHDRGAKRQRR